MLEARRLNHHVRAGDGQPVEFVDLDALAVGEGRPDRLGAAGLVVHLAVDLAGGDVALELRGELRQRQLLLGRARTSTCSAASMPVSARQKSRK